MVVRAGMVWWVGDVMRVVAGRGCWFDDAAVGAERPVPGGSWVLTNHCMGALVGLFVGGFGSSSRNGAALNLPSVAACVGQMRL